MERLYEENPFLTDFDAAVLSCTQGKKGYEVVLDRTAFYPEGGGQPWDTGVLGGVPVLEVHAREGQVVTVFGRDGKAVLPVEEVAGLMGTIHYEVVCQISKRVPRLFVEDGRVVGQLNYIVRDPDAGI